MSDGVGATVVEQQNTGNIKLHNNRHIENLTEENDLFGVTKKADAISNVLINSTDEFIDNNMLALYGNWGSGKTSVMKYIQNKLDSQCNPKNHNKKRFKTIFFEAWKYEKDNNLTLSLFEQLLHEIYKDQSIESKVRENIKEVGEALICISKHILFNSKINIPATGMGIDIGKATEAAFTEIDNEERSSLYSQVQKFESKFRKLESKICEYYENIIVFIDDLDRCQPENILNLLASIKLFFAQSKKIIYFSGIDKDAVKKAVDHRYKDVIKSEEYLEKIFDITFNMPPSKDIKKVVNNHFMGDSGEVYKYCNQLNEFFITISFTNPRHIKKIFNKFELLRRYKKALGDSLFPNIEDDNNILLIIFTLYLIILHEFYNHKFQEINSLEQRFESYIKYQLIEANGSQSVKISTARWVSTRAYLEDIKRRFYNIDVLKNSFEYDEINKSVKSLMDIIHIFMPIANKEYELGSDLDFLNDDKRLSELDKYINQFENNENKILTSFCKFLITINQKIEEYEQDASDFKLLNLFEVIKLYL